MKLGPNHYRTVVIFNMLSYMFKTFLCQSKAACLIVYQMIQVLSRSSPAIHGMDDVQVGAAPRTLRKTLSSMDGGGGLNSKTTS